MTKDEIIRKSPPISALDFGVPAEWVEHSERYARWAAAAEREACFQIAITIGDHSAGCRHTDEVAAAIRARGEQ